MNNEPKKYLSFILTSENAMAFVKFQAANPFYDFMLTISENLAVVSGFTKLDQDLLPELAKVLDGGNIFTSKKDDNESK